MDWLENCPDLNQNNYFLYVISAKINFKKY